MTEPEEQEPSRPVDWILFLGLVMAGAGIPGVFIAPVFEAARLRTMKREHPDAQICTAAGSTEVCGSTSTLHVGDVAGPLAVIGSALVLSRTEKKKRGGTP